MFVPRRDLAGFVRCSIEPRRRPGLKVAAWRRPHRAPGSLDDPWLRWASTPGPRRHPCRRRDLPKALKEGGIEFWLGALAPHIAGIGPSYSNCQLFCRSGSNGDRPRDPRHGHRGNLWFARGSSRGSSYGPCHHRWRRRRPSPAPSLARGSTLPACRPPHTTPPPISHTRVGGVRGATPAGDACQSAPASEM